MDEFYVMWRVNGEGKSTQTTDEATARRWYRETIKAEGVYYVALCKIVPMSVIIVEEWVAPAI